MFSAVCCTVRASHGGGTVVLSASNRVLVLLSVLALSTNSRADSVNGLRSSVARIGDVNGDGIPDLAIASRESVMSGRSERVWILSGKDGTRLLEIRGREAGDRFGSAIGAIGDWDGDGVPDLFIAAEPDWQTRSTEHPGYRRLISGRNGGALEELPGSGAIGGTRDLDGDGKLDLLLVVEDLAHDCPKVMVVSGKDGQELVRGPLPTPLANERRQTVDALTWIGDIDGDGCTDFVFSMRRDVKQGKSLRTTHELTAVSGLTASLLWSRAVDAEDRESGWATVVAFADTTADGVPEVLCSVEDLHVRLLDGKNGAILFERKAPRSCYYSYASTLDRVGDLDRDGIEDWILGANESWEGFFDPWPCAVISGKNGDEIHRFAVAEDFGFDVCGLGDVNDDTVPDFVIGMERQDRSKPGSGKDPVVKVRSGRDASVLWVRRHADLRN